MTTFEDQLVAGGYAHLWIGVTVYHGRLIGRDIPAGRFGSVSRQGTNFAKANFNFSVRDILVPNPRYGPDTGDVFAVPDPTSLRRIPFRPASAIAFGYLKNEDGELWDGCPRGALKRATEALAARGLEARVAFEPEFYLLRPGTLEPASTSGMYSVAGIDHAADFVEQLGETLAAMDVGLEAIGKEYGSGQYEANIAPRDPLTAVDDLIRLRMAVNHVARDCGFDSTFMPKIDANMAGCGLHLHLSLWDTRSGENRTAGDAAGGLSDTAAAFMEGWLRHAGSLTAFGAPTPNSYKRLQPSSWAPKRICWSTGNRGALVRVPGSGSRARLELRIGDNTANPYLMLAAVIRSGLDGIEHAFVPREPIAGDVDAMSAAERSGLGIDDLPRDLTAALDALAADSVLVEGIGQTITDEYLRIKRWEAEEYQRQVSDWERETYLRES